MSGQGVPSSHAQQRGAPRHKLFEPVTIVIDGLPCRAHLLDLSSSGALAHCETPPLSGATVIVDMPGLIIPARVVWVRVKRFGLRFDVPLSQELVERLIGAITMPGPRVASGSWRS